MITTSGLIDAHSHLRSTSLRDQGVVGSCLEEAILRMNAMTGIDPFKDAFVASCDALLEGITGVQVIFHTFGSSDHYLETLDATIKGIERAGIRAQIILAMTDQFEFLPARVEGKFDLPSFIDPGRRMPASEFESLFREAQRRHPERDFGIGPVGPQWCSDSLMETISNIASTGLRVHTHCLESRVQRNWIDESPIARMARFNLLGAKTSLAHAIWLADSELELIAESGTTLVTCPHSNQQLGSGKADLSAWGRRKIRFGIGLDSIGPPLAPLPIARSVLSSEDALHALIQGGSDSTGLQTSDDRVTFADQELISVENVTVAGRSLVKANRHLLHDELEAIRAEIVRRLGEDQSSRINRQSEIDSIIHSYLVAIAD